MIKFDTKQVRLEAIEDKKALKPKPVISIGSTPKANKVTPAPPIETKVALVIDNLPPAIKQGDLPGRQAGIDFYLGRKEALELEYTGKKKDIYIERAKISNKARECWKAGAERGELRDLYLAIEAKTEEMALITILIEHIQKFGELPNERIMAPSSDLLSMKDRKRKLINQRDKLRRNLRPNAKAPKNSERRSHWEQTLALLDAEYQDLVDKINRINYESRD